MKVVGSLVICGFPYEVVEVDESDGILADGEEGSTRALELRIYIRAGLPWPRRRDTILHEIAHAFFEATGLLGFITAHTKKSAEADRFEENLIRLATPWLLQLIDTSGPALGRLLTPEGPPT